MADYRKDYFRLKYEIDNLEDTKKILQSLQGERNSFENQFTEVDLVFQNKMYFFKKTESIKVFLEVALDKINKQIEEKVEELFRMEKQDVKRKWRKLFKKNS